MNELQQYVTAAAEASTPKTLGYNKAETFIM
jgi:hypothetical protein